jgi:hypothetical protein
MKKRIIILVASMVLIFSSSYARGKAGIVPENVSAEFERAFFFASNVNWENVAGYYKASFNVHDKTLYAFYTEDADFMGIASNMLSDKLPVSLQTRLRKDYSNYWVTDLFKVEGSGAAGYFITLENGDQKIMLKAEGNQGWAYYKTIKKD